MPDLDIFTKKLKNLLTEFIEKKNKDSEKIKDYLSNWFSNSVINILYKNKLKKILD